MKETPKPNYLNLITTISYQCRYFQNNLSATYLYFLVNFPKSLEIINDSKIRYRGNHKPNLPKLYLTTVTDDQIGADYSKLSVSNI